ncbi:unnamed protein product, partial [Effrenium voratum]
GQDTLQPNQLDYVFMTNKTGFEVSFLRYHDGASQFRCCLSAKAIAWCQEDALWPADHCHTRFNKDYSAALLYYNVLSEADLMWASL